ncbi:MAG: carbon-nitrogen hydrolase family protein [Nocardioides sp.]|uniref:carbon-nitrogen hydrolase family protein n=1 Tax=Nocardioides sp. TaxID=35761 RepID=UPI003F016E81
MSGDDETGADLRVRVVQWGASLDAAANRARLGDAVAVRDGEPVDLVVLPEAFARDFGKPGTDLGEHAEPTDGPFATELARVAGEAGTTAVAGMFEPSGEPSRPYNTLVMRGGASADYRKIHLYDSFGYRESDRVSGGPLEPRVVDVDGWKVGLTTCYDLRFPELYRALADEGAEVVLVLAAWLPGERKVDHWRTLLAARAIENTVYVVGVGQPEDHYCGHSTVVGPLGDVLLSLGGGEDVGVVTLSRSGLSEARAANPSLANRRL